MSIVIIFINIAGFIFKLINLCFGIHMPLVSESIAFHYTYNLYEFNISFWYVSYPGLDIQIENFFPTHWS